MKQQNLKSPINTDRLASTFGDDPVFIAEMYGMYVEDTSPRIDELAGAIDAGDIERSRRIAHAVKGSSGNIGAELMFELATDLEKADFDQNGHARDLFTQLREEFKAVRGFVDHYLHSAE